MTTLLPTLPGLEIALPLEAEDRLLLVCARLSLGPADREVLERLLGQPLQWDQVLEKARWQRLLGLVYYHLRRPEHSHRVPNQIMEELRGIYRLNTARHLFRMAELRKILDAFREQEIPVVVLKGAALVELVYPDPGVRPMSDMDLLVPPQDADRAFSIVCGLGYAPTGDIELQETLRADDRQLALLAGVGKPVAIEIHTHIVDKASPLRFDIATFWENALESSIAGAPSLILRPEYFVMHLIVNFLKDRRFTSYAALGQLTDVAEVIRFSEFHIDWPAFGRAASDLGLGVQAFYGLYLSRWLLDAPVPDGVLKELQPPDFHHKDVERLVRHRILRRDWVAKGLVAPNVRYRWWNIPGSMVRRVFPGKRYLAKYYDVPVPSHQFSRLYFRRLFEAIPVFARLIARPDRAIEDLVVDHWLHSLYHQGRNGLKRDKNAGIAGTTQDTPTRHWKAQEKNL